MKYFRILIHNCTCTLIHIRTCKQNIFTCIHRHTHTDQEKTIYSAISPRVTLRRPLHEPNFLHSEQVMVNVAYRQHGEAIYDRLTISLMYDIMLHVSCFLYVYAYVCMYISTYICVCVCVCVVYT